MSDTLYLVPPIVEAGRSQELVENGQTLYSTFSPANASLAVFVSPSKHGSAEDFDQDSNVYFASLDAIPSAERRLFLTDTYTIYTYVQNMAKDAKRDSGWTPTRGLASEIRNYAINYVNFAKECWVHSAQSSLHGDTNLQYPSDHYRSLYSCLALFVILYLPEDGFEGAPVGEDLTDWLNRHYIEPSTEEGDQLSSLESPWEDENFWPYLTRTVLRGLTKAAVFFFETLRKHPSDDLQEMATQMAAVVGGQPRLSNYSAEKDWYHAFRRWKDKVRALRVTMDRIPEENRFDDFENWWNNLSDILSILEGREGTIIRVCQDLGADWKEVVMAHVIFVNPRLRRAQLPDIVPPILEEMPVDPSFLEDLIQSALLSGDPEQALEHAARLDRWLSAHLADLMEPLSLLDSDLQSVSGLSIRDQHVISYAEYLHSDHRLWRYTVAYLYSCGNVGSARADEIMLRVPLRIHEQDSGASDSVIVGTLKDINESCFEHRREGVRRSICRNAAQNFIQRKNFGLAVSYYVSAEHWPGLGRVADRILDEYIYNGVEDFIRHASDISPALADLQSNTHVHSVFLYRLVFAVRYAQFHKLRQQGDVENAASDLISLLQDGVVPKAWSAILLCDSVEFLQRDGKLLFSSHDALELHRKLEEIGARATHGLSDEYFCVLARSIENGGQKEAMERLKIVRLALARYFARCSVAGSGSSSEH